MADKLWAFYADYGRMGDISSTFIASQEQIDNLVGKSVYMSDVLGKHSEVTITFKENDPRLTELKVSQQTVDELKSVIGCQIGGSFYPWDFEDQWEE